VTAAAKAALLAVNQLQPPLQLPQQPSADATSGFDYLKESVGAGVRKRYLRSHSSRSAHTPTYNQFLYLHNRPSAEY
jgi:hypothetical protein